MPDLKKLNPKQKRLLIALGAGAILALVVLLRRRQAPAADPAPQTAPQAALQGAGTGGGDFGGGSTFADNGPALAELNTTLSGIAGGLQTLLEQPPVSYAPSSPPPTTTPPAAIPDPVAPAAPQAPGPVGQVGTVAPGAGTGGRPTYTPGPSHGGGHVAVQTGGTAHLPSGPPARPAGSVWSGNNVFLQDSGPRANTWYRVVVKNGHTYRYYADGSVVLVH